MVDPDMGTWNYEYDANGNLWKQTDARGFLTEFKYNNDGGPHDPLNRIMKKIYQDGTQVNYTYDQVSATNGLGRLTSVSEASGNIETRYSYDERGRITSTTRTIDGTTNTIQSTYDSRDRLKTLTYPGNPTEQVSYFYDGTGNLVSVRSTDPQTPVYVNYQDFTAMGQPQTLSYGNNQNIFYNFYPETGRLWTISGTNQGYTYSYDGVGNITSIVDVIPTRSQEFVYDELNRLLTASSGTETLQFEYDTIGNMKFNTMRGFYQYEGPRPHAVTGIGGGCTYDYDANGNLTYGGLLTWNYDNRLASYGSSTSFSYDYQGQRVKKTGALGLYYFSKYYECVINGSCTKFIFAGKNRIARKTPTRLTYYHPDHLGGSNVITGGDGSVNEEMTYFPYGLMKTHSPVGDNVRHKFTGQEYDNETEMYYYGARYYSPKMARFISPDTIVPRPDDPQSLNRYSYAMNNPINRTDPTGHAAPWFHFGYTYEGARNYGSGIFGSLIDAFRAMAVDFSPSAFSSRAENTVNHAMGGSITTDRWQTPSESIQAAIEATILNAAVGRIPEADHTVVDIPTHEGASMRNFSALTHYREYDSTVSPVARQWAIEHTATNREIRDYYKQFDENSSYVPGPIFSYSSRYDLGYPDDFTGRPGPAPDSSNGQFVNSGEDQFVYYNGDGSDGDGSY